VTLQKPAGADDEADASHRGQLAVQPCVQPLNQARAQHQLWSDGGIWILVFRRVSIGFSLHQHPQLARCADRLSLPVVVHVDQRQR
jgi:hypothetical protein